MWCEWKELLIWKQFDVVLGLTYFAIRNETMICRTKWLLFCQVLKLFMIVSKKKNIQHNLRFFKTINKCTYLIRNNVYLKCHDIIDSSNDSQKGYIFNEPINRFPII